MEHTKSDKQSQYEDSFCRTIPTFLSAGPWPYLTKRVHWTEALEQTYIEINSGPYVSWLCAEIDRENIASWQNMICQPTLAILIPGTNNVVLAWRLLYPVKRSNTKAMRFYNEVSIALSAKLNGTLAEGSLLIPNPLLDKAIYTWSDSEVTLPQMADALGLEPLNRWETSQKDQYSLFSQGIFWASRYGCNDEEQLSAYLMRLSLQDPKPISAKSAGQFARGILRRMEKGRKPKISEDELHNRQVQAGKDSARKRSDSMLAHLVETARGIKDLTKAALARLAKVSRTTIHKYWDTLSDLLKKSVQDGVLYIEIEERATLLHLDPVLPGGDGSGSEAPRLEVLPDAHSPDLGLHPLLPESLDDLNFLPLLGHIPSEKYPNTIHPNWSMSKIQKFPKKLVHRGSRNSEDVRLVPVHPIFRHNRVKRSPPERDFQLDEAPGEIHDLFSPLCITQRIP